MIRQATGVPSAKLTCGDFTAGEFRLLCRRSRELQWVQERWVLPQWYIASTLRCPRDLGGFHRDILQRRGSRIPDSKTTRAHTAYAAHLGRRMAQQTFLWKYLASDTWKTKDTVPLGHLHRAPNPNGFQRNNAKSLNQEQSQVLIYGVLISGNLTISL